MSRSFVENTINCTCEYNFDVTADWTLTLDADYNPYPITDVETFKAWLGSGQDVNFKGQNNLTNIVVTNFKKSGNRIKCNLTADGTDLYMSGLNVSNFIKSGDLYSLEKLYLESNQISNFDPSIALPSGLLELSLGGNQISNFDPSIALPNSLRYLELTINQISNFDPSIPLPSSLLDLLLFDNQISNFNPSIALPSSLKNLYLAINPIVNFNPSIALPSSLELLVLTNCDIVAFNPTIPLPLSLKRLTLIECEMTLSGYIGSVPWATALHNAPIGGSIEFTNNIDSILGTSLQTILVGKGWNVIP